MVDWPTNAAVKASRSAAKRGSVVPDTVGVALGGPLTR
jgi:hypothetical protein